MITTTNPTECANVKQSSEENLNDVLNYITNEVSDVTNHLRSSYDLDLTSQLTERIFIQSNGVWLYAYFLLEELKSGKRSFWELDESPVELADYFAQFWLRWRSEHEDAWYEWQMKLLSALAAQRANLTMDMLCKITNINKVHQAIALLESDWKAFVYRSGSLEQPAYQLYHASLNDFLHGDCALSKSYHNTKLDQIRTEMVKETAVIHKKIGEYYIKKWGGFSKCFLNIWKVKSEVADDMYGIRFIVKHLKLGKEEDKIHRLLQCETLGGDGNLWYKVHQTLDTIDLYINDIKTAYLCAKFKCKNSGHLIKENGYLYLYSLCLSSLSSGVQQLPHYLICTLVKNGIWTDKRAIREIYKIPNSLSQAIALVYLSKEVKPELSKQLRYDAYMITASLDYPSNIINICGTMANFLGKKEGRPFYELGVSIESQTRFDFQMVYYTQTIKFLSNSEKLEKCEMLLEALFQNWEDHYGFMAIAKALPYIPKSFRTLCYKKLLEEINKDKHPLTSFIYSISNIPVKYQLVFFKKHG